MTTTRRLKISRQRFSERAETTRFGHPYEYPDLSLCGHWLKDAGIDQGDYVLVEKIKEPRHLLVRKASPEEAEARIRKLLVIGRPTRRNGRIYVYPKVRISSLYLKHLDAEIGDYAIVEITDEGLTIRKARNQNLFDMISDSPPKLSDS